MILDFVDLYTDDDDDDVAREEHGVHGQSRSHSFQVKEEFVDLTSTLDSSEGEYKACGQGDSTQNTTSGSREFIADDGESYGAAHCTTAPQAQESIAAHGQGNATQCTTTLRRTEFLTADDSMEEAMQSTSATGATTALLHRQDEIHTTNAFLNFPPAPTAARLPRQFWKAGEYSIATQAASNYGQNRLRVHPKFLHSNATSHKWAFGAIAELLDNAVDEIHNGATFVKIDKIKHAPDGEYSLLIQDDGGGMSPESLRRCMSFGFSQKCTTSSIGQYGNGFKTSTMRLGADVIVFSCRQDKDTRVDYELDVSSSTFKRITNCGEKQVSSNLSIILKWSPFSTEDELMNQEVLRFRGNNWSLFSRVSKGGYWSKSLMFIGMECHGTKIIVFNLWFNDLWQMELDFVTDEQDIMISGAPEIRAGSNTREWLKQMHVANRFRYSLRVYASILYLHLPKNFQIILCGRAVEPHCIVSDLIYRECIRYRPQVEEITEVDVITMIGFLRGAPKLDIYGFNVYHRNRLILPFWPAGSYKAQRRGIAGVLEAKFIRPTHDKQDFEKTGLFHRLETRLKDMATEYWRHHCHLVGYAYIAKRLPPSYYVSTSAADNDDNLVSQATTKNYTYNSRARSSVTLHPVHDALTDPINCNACPSTSINVGSTHNTSISPPQQLQTEPCKRRQCLSMIDLRAQKRRIINDNPNQSPSDDIVEMAEDEVRVIIGQNTMLKAECSKLEASELQLTSKADKLRNKLDMWRRIYKGITDELQSCARAALHGGGHQNSSLGYQRF
ncbi:hypothetical protein ACP4OV_013032 [Aristida adscensionis]